MKNKSLTCLFLIYILLLSGCIKIPNYQSNQQEGDNSSNFKYGKYCGKGNPAFASDPGSLERTKDLMSIWPPVDDVDMMCYAHDLCYQVAGTSNAICDRGFSGTASIHSRSFSKVSGCSNLVNLVGSGVGSKFWHKEDDKLGSLLSLAGVVLVPISMVIHSINHGDYKKFRFPSKEGYCFRNDNPRVHAKIIISDFEAEFREFAEIFLFASEKRAGKSDIQIPVPLKNWKKEFQIFEMQKYLNYFKFNAGPADGKFGTKTRLALRKFQKRKSSTLSGLPNENTLLRLKNDYMNRSGADKFNQINLSNPEFDELYGYLE